MANIRAAATKEDWEICPMPQKTASFTLKQNFTDQELENLRLGHIPGEMEDRWFTYCEDNTLYIHRSWSGICVYIVHLDTRSSFLSRFFPQQHRVIVNRDDHQYACDDIEEDKAELCSLLRYFSR